jgi:magnesium transporter
MGGFISVKVLGLFEGAMLKHGELFFFTLLQWQECRSAIISVGLANNTLSGSLFNRLIKRYLLAYLMG